MVLLMLTFEAFPQPYDTVLNEDDPFLFADGFEEFLEGTIIAPADSAILSEADDADPSAPGFQVSVFFATSNEATSFALTIAEGCDDAHAGCGVARNLAQGPVTNPGGAEPTTQITLALDGQTSYQRIGLIIQDALGNSHSSDVRITVKASSCSLSFTDLPPSDWFNGSVCANGTNCASATVTITVAQAGNCVGISSVSLFDDASLLATDSSPTVGGTSVFNVQLNDDETVRLKAKAFESVTEIGLSNVRTMTMDFTPPLVDFISANVEGFQTAATGESVLYNFASDLSIGTPGMQFHAQVSVTDTNADGGQLISLTAAGLSTVSLFPSNENIPLDLAGASPVTSNLLDMTLADLQTHAISVVGADAAGNRVSASYTAEVDLTPPPDPPAVLATNPPSPANDNNPKILGTADDDTIVHLYSDPGCFNSLASGSAESFSTTGIAISVADNSTTTVYGNATDAASNVSACSVTFVSYLEDSTPPD
jgi:hypothetical protein